MTTATKPATTTPEIIRRAMRGMIAAKTAPTIARHAATIAAALGIDPAAIIAAHDATDSTAKPAARAAAIAAALGYENAAAMYATTPEEITMPATKPATTTPEEIVSRRQVAAAAQPVTKQQRADAEKDAAAIAAALAEYDAAPCSRYAGKTPTTLHTVVTYTQGRAADAVTVLDSGLYKLPPRFTLPVALVKRIIDEGSAAAALGYEIGSGSAAFATALVAAFDAAMTDTRAHEHDVDWLRAAYRSLGPDYVTMRERRDQPPVYTVRTVTAETFVRDILTPAIRRDAHPRAVTGFVYDRSAQARMREHAVSVRTVPVVVSRADTSDRAADAWDSTRAGRRARRAALHRVDRAITAAQDAAAAMRAAMTSADAAQDRAAAIAAARAALDAAQDAAQTCAARYGTMERHAPALAALAALVSAAEDAAALVA